MGPLREDRPERIISEHLFICHRGVDPLVIDEIVATLTKKHQYVTVQDGDGLSLPLPELRALVRQQAEDGRRIIVLLNEHLSGPVFRQTFSPLRKAVPNLYIYCFRVELCDSDGVDRFDVDLADVTDAVQRKLLIRRIVRDLSKEECR